VDDPQCTDEIHEVVLEVFPGKGRHVHYSDDGQTLDYSGGKIHILEISVHGNEVTQKVRLKNYEGSDELFVKRMV
jgi:hypothetical protein